MTAVRMKRTVKLLTIVAMACFFLPFITISCANKDGEIRGGGPVSGIELVGVSLQMLHDINSENISDVVQLLSFFLPTAALLLGLAGFVLAHLPKAGNRKMLAAGVCNGGSALLLLLFRFTFFPDASSSKAPHAALVINYKYGWALSMTFFLCAALCAFLSQRLFRPGAIEPGTGDAPAQVAGSVPPDVKPPDAGGEPPAPENGGEI